MREQFVTAEIALKMYDMGYDENCLAFSDSDGKFEMKECRNSTLICYGDVALPLWQQVIMWLDKQGVEVIVTSNIKQDVNTMLDTLKKLK